MKATDYEKTYLSVKNAVNDTKHLDAVVKFLRKQSEPVTCATIGEAVFGDQYHSYYLGKSCQGMMGQMLRHLRKGGFIKIDFIDGTPVEVPSWEWVDVAGAPPTKIRVHDEDGNEYWIDNPKYDCHYRRAGRYEEVKRTIIPKVKVYRWVAE